MNVLFSLSLSVCRTVAAHVIVQFTLRLLLGDGPFPPSEPDASRSLCGAFVFVCRQMYNTCEGLRALRPFGLHKAVAAAWQKVPAQNPLTEIWSDSPPLCFSAPFIFKRSLRSGELEKN